MERKKEYLSEEKLIVRHSGEIPEVAYHGSIYYLTKDPDGPGIVLDKDDLETLKEEVIHRYTTIMMRDLTPENRDKGMYRGLARCMCNWRRLCLFCGKEKRDVGRIRAETAAALLHLMRREIADARSDIPSCINCTVAELEEFAGNLELNPDIDLPTGWRELCL